MDEPTGRVPRATTWAEFFDASLAARDPGQWPLILQQAWGRTNAPTQPVPHADDIIPEAGTRAEQYNS